MNWLFECDRCCYAKRASWPLSLYRIEANSGEASKKLTSSDLTVDTDICWCYGCNNLTLSERIRSIEILKDQFRRHRNALETSDSDWTRQRLVELVHKLNWRRNRRSAPKCLECGATAIKVMITDNFDLLQDEFSQYAEKELDLTHPECGGRLVKVGGEFLQHGGCCLYTPEGDAITDIG